jgi:catechol-2,3-dioxygenase
MLIGSTRFVFQTIYNSQRNEHTHTQFGLGKLNHVAIAVPDLKAAVALYRDTLGAQVSEEQVRVALVGCK